MPRRPRGEDVHDAGCFAALARSGFSRRGFLKTSGALIVGFQIVDWQTKAQGPGGPSPGSPPINQLDSWIAIAADGSVTAYSGKEELGQGISTAQAQLVAEELSVPFHRVKLIYCDTALTPDQAYTSGSQSHPANFNHGNLAQAGATAREALIKMASQKLGVPVDELTAAAGAISAKSDPSKKVTYGQLVGGKKFRLALDPQAKRKPPSEWTVLGTPVQRPDMPEIVTGQFEFVHNVRVPGMLHGRVVRPPAAGATVMSVDESSVEGMPGLVKVVVKKNFVGVVAEKPWQALQAAEKLKVTWSSGSGLAKRRTFTSSCATRSPRATLCWWSRRTWNRSWREAAAVVKATYLHPYQAHGSMGSSCAVADVQGDKATIWSPTQGVWYQRSTAAMVLGLKPENVRVIFRRGSGCYGLNAADTVTYDAALLSQAAGQTGARAAHPQGRNGVGELRQRVPDGRARRTGCAGQHHRLGSRSLVSDARQSAGPGTPGNVITGLLVGFQPEAFTPQIARARTAWL